MFSHIFSRHEESVWKTCDTGGKKNEEVLKQRNTRPEWERAASHTVCMCMCVTILNGIYRDVTRFQRFASCQDQGIPDASYNFTMIDAPIFACFCSNKFTACLSLFCSAFLNKLYGNQCNLSLLASLIRTEFLRDFTFSFLSSTLNEKLNFFNYVRFSFKIAEFCFWRILRKLF